LATGGLPVLPEMPTPQGSCAALPLEVQYQSWLASPLACAGIPSATGAGLPCSMSELTDFIAVKYYMVLLGALARPDWSWHCGDSNWSETLASFLPCASTLQSKEEALNHATGGGVLLETHRGDTCRLHAVLLHCCNAVMPLLQ
jgi:hypothetical protein